MANLIMLQELARRKCSCQMRKLWELQPKENGSYHQRQTGSLEISVMINCVMYALAMNVCHSLSCPPLRERGFGGVHMAAGYLLSQGQGSGFSCTICIQAATDWFPVWHFSRFKKSEVPNVNWINVQRELNLYAFHSERRCEASGRFVRSARELEPSAFT